MYTYKIKKDTSQICRNKLHGEIGQLEVDYAFMHDENEITLIFQDINIIETKNEEGNVTDTKYTKDNYVDALDEEGEVIGQKNEPIDFTTEMLGIIAEIDNCVAVHDPTPLVQPKSETEQIKDDLAMFFSMILQDRGWA